MDAMPATRNHRAKQPLGRFLWPLWMLLLISLVGLVVHFFPHIQLQINRTRGVPEIEQFGGRVPTWWSDAANQGWTTAREAAAGIDLDGSTITDRDLAVLKNFPHVYHVSLRHTAITDQGLSYLEDMPHLTVVRLEGTEVSREAREELRDFLKRRAAQRLPIARP